MSIKGETDHCRHRLMKYCRGQGVDLGCGNTRIKMDAIGIDLNNPNADMKADARVLSQFPDEHFDYVFSSHLLEELQNTEATLKEWLRILKPDGYMVLYQADKALYYPLGHPNCNPTHKHHFSWQDLWAVFEHIGGVKLVHHGAHPENREWSFELVVRKDGPLSEERAKHGQGISILVPTLNRPDSVETFAKAVDETTDDPSNVEIVYGVHEDDNASIERIPHVDSQTKISVRHEIIDRFHDGKPHLSFLWNQIFDKAKYPIVGYFGDDVIFKTPGWDKEVRQEMKDRSVMVLCNDVHVQKGKQATLFFTHRTFHEKVGYYLSMNFRRWFADTMWDMVYKGSGRLHYREDIITEHLHPDKFPERVDDTYKNMDHFKEDDRRVWNQEGSRQEAIRCSDILKNMNDNKWVISFSLWGSDPKYLIGAVENAKLQRKFYPGWICRFYVDETVPQETLNELISLGAEIVKEEIADGYKGLFWRFQPAFDPNVERFIVRDCDSRLNEREAIAVTEWVNSSTGFHTMRDHKGHDITILGAMWGAKRGAIPDFKNLQEEFLKKLDSEQVMKRDRFFYTDQTFLNNIIWPKVKDNCLIHDDAKRFDQNERPFAVKLPEGQFVGQQWGADNKPLTAPI